MKLTQCIHCNHWKPQKNYWTHEIRYYCELTGYRSKDDWKNHKCSAFEIIKNQAILEEFS